MAKHSRPRGAFGDMILFVLVAGFVGLAPTWFLLKLFIEKAPRALLAVAMLMDLVPLGMFALHLLRATRY